MWQSRVDENTISGRPTAIMKDNKQHHQVMLRNQGCQCKEFSKFEYIKMLIKNIMGSGNGVWLREWRCFSDWTRSKLYMSFYWLHTQYSNISTSAICVSSTTKHSDNTTKYSRDTLCMSWTPNTVGMLLLLI